MEKASENAEEWLKKPLKMAEEMQNRLKKEKKRDNGREMKVLE